VILVDLSSVLPGSEFLSKYRPDHDWVAIAGVCLPLARNGVEKISGLLEFKSIPSVTSLLLSTTVFSIRYKNIFRLPESAEVTAANAC
jgi:hypothetical protein